MPLALRPRLTLAALLAAAAAAVAAPAARAADWYTGAEVPGSGEDWIVAVGASGTVTSTGTAFAATAATIAVTGNLNESGVRARVEGLAGRYRRAGAGSGERAFGEQVEGTISAGYQYVADPVSISGYLGLNVRENSQNAVVPTGKTDGTVAGVKGALELYMEPSKHTMVAAFGSYSTAYNAYYARVKAGYEVGDRVFFGPEAAVLGDDLFRQWRVGLHLTGFKVGPVQFGVSAGYLQEEKVGGGVYTMLDARAGF